MNCIVIDDEPLAREKLKFLIGQDVSLNLCGCFGSPALVQEFLEINAIELVFLDIQMPGYNGLDFARILGPDVMIIFTTAYSEYATESYTVHAIDYLLKPIHPDRFGQAVLRAKKNAELLSMQKTQLRQMLGTPTDHIFVKHEKRFHKLIFADCLYIEGLKDYSLVYLKTQRLIVNMNLKALHEQLPADLFVRISKSYVVNVSHISSADHQDVRIGEQQLMIGNAYRANLFSTIIRVLPQKK